MPVIVRLDSAAPSSGAWLIGLDAEEASPDALAVLRQALPAAPGPTPGPAS